jgi:hypothetical protein
MCIMVLGNTNAVHYERISISDAARALHFMGSRGADVYGIADIVLYPRDPRALGVQWVHQVPAQIHTLRFLGCGLTRPF